MAPEKLRIGYSPHPHDAFVLYAATAGRVETRGYRIEPVVDEIESLNRRAVEGDLEASAVSIHAYAHLSEQYALAPCGAILGEGSGPMVVSRAAMDREALAQAKFAVPGTMTSAFLALQLYLQQGFSFRVVPVDGIVEAVASGEFDAGLVIHGSQFTYHEAGLEMLVDLGLWWADRTDGLPLPLGALAVRRDLAPGALSALSDILRDSVAYGFEHHDEAAAYARRFAGGMSDEDVDRYLALYVNDLTRDLGERGVGAIRRFLDEGAEAGLIPRLRELPLIA